MWESRDAWLLQAVTYAGRRGSLADVLAAADAINVSIATREELQRHIGRLELADLVSTTSGTPRVTPAGRKLVRRAGRGQRGIRTIPAELETLLNREVEQPAGESTWGLTTEDWDRAYDEYLNRMGARSSPEPGRLAMRFRIARVVGLLLIAAASYVGWTAAIADQDSNTTWSVLLSIAFYGAVLGLVYLAVRALWKRRQHPRE